MHALLHSVPLTLKQATADPRLCQRLLDTHRQVWSVSRGAPAPFSWVLVHRVLFLPSQSLFPQCWVCSGSSVGHLMETSSKSTYVIPRSADPEPLSLWQATADQPTQERLKHSKASLAQSVEFPGTHKFWFEPSECLWKV